MDFELKDKVALVTGSSEGIGFAIAQALAQEGVKVYINGRSKEKVAAAIQQLKKEKIAHEPLPALFDLSKASETSALFQQIPAVDSVLRSIL